MRLCFEALANELDRVCDGRPIAFFLNDGNWGDGLIREGAETFFKHYGFRYHMVKVLDVQKRKVSLNQIKKHLSHTDPVAVFNGGGSYDPRYDRLPFLRELATQFSSNVFLPASYPSNMSDGFPQETLFYARDKGESLKNVADARFCHDMAFFLSPQKTPPLHSIGVFMREDGERPADAPIPHGNRDISREGRAHTPVKKFLATIARYETVYTNRLHVCIGATILGRRVHFFPNNYFKNKMVFDASLKPNFPSVTFEEDYEQLAKNAPDLHYLNCRFKKIFRRKHK